MADEHTRHDEERVRTKNNNSDVDGAQYTEFISLFEEAILALIEIAGVDTKISTCQAFSRRKNSKARNLPSKR